MGDGDYLGAYVSIANNNINFLAVAGEWGSWGSFGSCNSITGKKRRTRQCNNPKPLNGGKDCPGKSYEDMSCPGMYM